MANIALGTVAGAVALWILLFVFVIHQIARGESFSRPSTDAGPYGPARMGRTLVQRGRHKLP
jgi:hypothetical protein